MRDVYTQPRRGRVRGANRGGQRNRRSVGDLFQVHAGRLEDLRRVANSMNLHFSNAPSSFGLSKTENINRSEP
ncbi:Uncharacterised protein [Mycobacteroides abscessus]|nr:Uncharacterised protein [Mycobacteroides abscessus]SHS53270.1 Uncharacterised protein [Mycobacteroides abscessus subsp. abscessus]CPS50363.1 Uncharacterised protein [Mycobacteroides abscessus]CPS93863.1 Uncharacterised protein [Mycobacteroides abscessus]CPS94149.1 Uncharacterised protein [Mycobacteroides abscessus]